MQQSFKYGDVVIWLKQMPSGYVFPFQAKVLAITRKRVKIEIDDPAEDGSGLVVRHVPQESLQLVGAETGSVRFYSAPVEPWRKFAPCPATARLLFHGGFQQAGPQTQSRAGADAR